MFSVRAPDHLNCFSKVPVEWARNEALDFLLVTMLLILFYYIGLAVQGSADEESGIWLIPLTAYVSMAVEMFAVSARDDSTLWYYTLCPRCDHLSGGVIPAFQKDCACAQVLLSVPVCTSHVH